MKRRSHKRQRNIHSARADDAYKQAYGHDALVTRLGHITIVHLDLPSPNTIQQRVQEVIREELSGEAFDEDCALCRTMHQLPYDIVYYDTDI